MKYRTIEFWHYRNADRVEVTISRGERGQSAGLIDREYLRPTLASIRRLSRLLSFMEPEGRPDNVRLTIWTDGTAMSAEATVDGPLYQPTTWADAAALIEQWDDAIAEGVNPRDIVTDFFDKTFRGRPLGGH